MAQTKRKRRNKHRGNAVGAVEARGRTSKPREEQGKSRSRGSGSGRAGGGGRGARPLKQPTLQSAALKALFGVVILFVFFQISGGKNNVGSSLALCVVAFVLYTPLMYMTDKWIYQRKLKQLGGSR